MARQVLGALTTLNLATNLDPMFSEIYSGAFAGFTFASNNFGIGMTPALAIDITRAPPTAGSDGFRYSNGSGRSFQLMMTGATYSYSGVGANELWLYAQGVTPVNIGPDGAGPVKIITNGAERMRIDSAGNVGIGSTSIPTLGGTGPILDMYNGSTQPAITFHNSVSGQVANRGGMIRMTAANLDFTNFEATGLINLSTNSITRLIVNASGGVLPGADNTQPLGGGSARWSVVYAGTGAINTSDAREKTAVEELDALEIAASIALGKEIGGFKFLSAIKEKGSGDARFHIGMTVQRAIEVMKDHGLDPLAYAFICHDKWAESTTPEETDEEGNVTRESVTTPAGDRYGFRVDELSLFIMRGLVARLDALEA